MFVPEDGETDSNITLVGGDPEEVCFTTEYCEVYAVVKAGQAYEIVEVIPATDGAEFCFEALPNPNGGEDNTYGISFVAFYCEEPDPENVPGLQGTGKGGGPPTR